jgi:hypothetical protein
MKKIIDHFGKEDRGPKSKIVAEFIDNWGFCKWVEIFGQRIQEI